MKRWKIYVAAAIGLLLAGFFIGRATIPMKEVVRYVRLPAVRGSLTSFDLTPIAETFSGQLKFITVFRDVPAQADPQHPLKLVDPVAWPAAGREIDTLASYVATVVDWNVRRTYAKTLFDTKELGKFSFTAEVQYNTLDGFDYDFQPTQREVTQVKTMLWQPFASIEYNTFEQGSVGIGTFYKNVGGQVKVVRDFRGQRTAVGCEVFLKF